jgi:hypothetical protein
MLCAIPVRQVEERLFVARRRPIRNAIQVALSTTRGGVERAAGNVDQHVCGGSRVVRGRAKGEPIACRHEGRLRRAPDGQNADEGDADQCKDDQDRNESSAGEGHVRSSKTAMR